MSAPEPDSNAVDTGSSVEQDSARNQKILQNRLKKELTKQQIRFMQKQKEKQFFSQAPIHDSLSIPSFSAFNSSNPPGPPPTNDGEPILQGTESQRPFYNHEDYKSFPVSPQKFTPPPSESFGSGRARKKKLDPRIDFDYNTRSGFIPRAFDRGNSQRLSDKPLAVYRGSPKAEEEKENIQRHATIKTRFMTDEGFLDSAHIGRDESKYVTIIPADESKTLDLEFLDWNRHRRIFLGLFAIAVALIIIIVVLTVYAARTYFVNAVEPSHKDGFLKFVYHADSMIVGTILLGAVGIVIFRLFPNCNPNTIIKIHIGIFTLVTGLFTWGFVIAFKYHVIVTGVDEHAYSIHSWAGFVCVGLGIFTILSGIYLTIFRGKCAAMIKYHSVGGMITFIFCGAACVSGYLVRAIVFNGHSYATYDNKTKINNTTGALIIIFCLLVRYISTDFRFRRRAKPQWDVIFARKVSQYEYASLEFPGTLEEYVTRITTMSDL